MTTGRINQVTILTRPPERRGATSPEGGGRERYRAGMGGDGSHAQPRAPGAPEESRRRATDSIAPTEFPRG